MRLVKPTLLALGLLSISTGSSLAEDFYNIEINFRCEYELNGLVVWKHYQLSHNPNQTLLYTTERSGVAPEAAWLNIHLMSAMTYFQGNL